GSVRPLTGPFSPPRPRRWNGRSTAASTATAEGGRTVERGEREGREDARPGPASLWQGKGGSEGASRPAPSPREDTSGEPPEAEATHEPEFPPIPPTPYAIQPPAPGQPTGPNRAPWSEPSGPQGPPSGSQRPPSGPPPSGRQGPPAVPQRPPSGPQQPPSGPQQSGPPQGVGPRQAQRPVSGPQAPPPGLGQGP